jgi:hypothetical protein
VSLFDGMVVVVALPPGERQRAFARIDADHGLLSGYPDAVHAMDYHCELEHLEFQRLQITALIELVEADIARAEQGRWPAALSAEAAKRLTLEAVSPREARLLLREAGAAEHFLSLTEDRVP